MGLNDGIVVSDRITAIELVDCTPEPELEPVSDPLPAQTHDSPVQQAMQATLTQTGADPPPMVTRG